MPRARKIPAKLRDAASAEDLDAAEEESIESAPESPFKLQRTESTSSSSDLASPGEKMHLNNALGSSIPSLPVTNMIHLTQAINQANYPGQMFQGPGNGTTGPIYPCGICQKEVDDDDDAILCETGCSKWYHRICTGLTVSAYSMLTSAASAEWVCNKCIETKTIPLVKLNS